MSSVAGNRRPKSVASSMQRPRITASSSARLSTATSSSLSTPTVATSSSTTYTTSPELSATTTDRLVTPSVTSTSPGLVGTCSIARDCTAGRACSGGPCVNANGAAPLGGPGSEPTSRLSTASAVGLGVGLIALIALMSGLAFCFWRIRRRPRKPLEAPEIKRLQSPPTDSQTRGVLTPDMPQRKAFPNNTVAPVFFTNAPSHNNISREKPVQAPVRSYQRVDSVTAKDLPAPPLHMENPLPLLPTESKRYSINVNLDKRLVLDNEMVITLGPVRDPVQVQAHAPQYKFQQYLSPMAKPRPISIKPAVNKRAPGNEPKKQMPAQESNKRTPDLELAPYPGKPVSVQTATTAEDALEDDFSSSEDEEIPRVRSEPPQLALPQLRPPSTGFNFNSNDWYQYITGNATSTTSRNSGSTPAQPPPPLPLSSTPKTKVPPPLVPAPLNTAASVLRLFPLPSPSSTTYCLSPHALVPPTPTSPPARLSVLSTMTRATRNSRSWLPEGGLYLPDETGAEDAFKQFKRPDDVTLPATTYSPLT